MEEKFYTFPIVLTGDFFNWLYAQPEADTLKYVGEGFQKFKFFKAKKKCYKIEYGGRFGTQFLLEDQKDTFKAKFEKLLLDNHIELKHMAPLLYLINFYDPFSEQESILTNRNNHLLENAKFILDLIRNSWPVYVNLKNDPEYKEGYDEYTQEYFFVKKSLLKDLADEEALLTYVSPKKANKELIRFQRVNIYDKILYIPNDLIFTIKCTSKRNLKRFSATSTTKDLADVKLPYHFNFYLFNYTLKFMLDEHKKNKTDFYRELSKDLFDFNKLDELYESHGKNKFDKYQVLEKVVLLALKYLKENKVFKFKEHYYSFLFDYFSMFNIFPSTKQNSTRTKSKTKFSQEKTMTRDKFIQVVKDIVKKASKENKSEEKIGEI